MNQWRSPTAEKLYSKEPFINVRSAGTSSKARRHISLKDLKWADTVIVMELKHKQRLAAEQGGKVAPSSRTMLAAKAAYPSE